MSLINVLMGIPAALAQRVDAGEIATETESQLTQLVSYVIGQIPLWITAFIVLVFTFVAAKMAKSAVENKMAAEGFEEENKEVAILASRAANSGVLVVGITVALKIAGIDLTAIIAAGAFGVGFALQDIIMNFIAGVMILSSRHYSIGDIIKVNGQMGKIVEIQTRATILKAFDGTKIVVPNAALFKNQVTSFTSNPFRRIELINGVEYGADLKRTMEVVLEAVKNTKGILAEPKPAVVFYEWGDYSINFKVRAWVESRSAWLKTRNRMLLNINKALEDSGIPIPYPIQTIELKQAEEEEQMEQLVTGGGEEQPQGPVKLEPAPVTVPARGQQTPPSTEYVAAPTWLKKASEESGQPAATPVQPSPQAQAQPQPEEQKVAAGGGEPKPIPGIRHEEAPSGVAHQPGVITPAQPEAPVPEQTSQQPAPPPLAQQQELAPEQAPASPEQPAQPEMPQQKAPEPEAMTPQQPPAP